MANWQKDPDSGLTFDPNSKTVWSPELKLWVSSSGKGWNGKAVVDISSNPNVGRYAQQAKKLFAPPPMDMTATSPNPFASIMGTKAAGPAPTMAPRPAAGGLGDLATLLGAR